MKIVHQLDKDYQSIFTEFLNVFKTRLQELMEMDDYLEFSINAWNFANMLIVLPENKIEEMEENIRIDYVKEEADIMVEMIQYKKQKYKNYTSFITEYDLNKDGTFQLDMVDEDRYLSDMIGEMIDPHHQEEYEPNYVDRIAVIVRPLDPFKDWINSIYPDKDTSPFIRTNTYLFHRDRVMENFLETQYHKIVENHLQNFMIEKSIWPEIKNYDTFSKWFAVEISVLVYDMEELPVSKGEFI